MTPAQLYSLYQYIPQVRAIRELDYRNMQSELDPEDAYKLVYRATNNRDLAEKAYSDAVLEKSRQQTARAPV